MASESTLSSDGHARPATEAIELPHLFVAMCCASPFAAPSRHALDGVDVVHIGRGKRTATRRRDDDRNVLALTIDNRFASTQHATLVRRDGGWFFEDAGSKNGSFVNGARPDGRRLDDGDCLQVGHTLLVLRTALPTPPLTPRDVVASTGTPSLTTLVPALARDLEIMAKVASSSTPVLLASETGTGKELLARAIHDLSGRGGAFVAVNCGGLPRTLFESVLFGHKRGAFSGAVSDYPGLFCTASGGTLLLDEVGDMPADVQSAVLRTLQDGEVLAVGSTRPVHVDVRVVAATHWDLEARVAEGAFREDLFARLAGYTFRLPPLRERCEDIGLLAGVLLRRIAGGRDDYAPRFGVAAALALMRYSWPRNVRELEKCLVQAAAVAGDAPIELEHLPQALKEAPRQRTAPPEPLDSRLLRLLGECQGNVTLVAAAMKTSRSQVHRWMKRLAIEPETFRRRIDS